MATDPYEERFKQHEEMIQGLARIWERHGVIIEELREFNRQQGEINARLETLVTEMFRQKENGREA